MNRLFPLLVAAVALLLPFTASAQVPNEGLANGIVSARQKNAALLKQYNWNCRTEILKDGQSQDLRVDLVTLGADGQPQKTLLNDQPGQLPGGFLRKRIAEQNREDLEKHVQKLGKLLDQYTLPSAGKIIAFLVQAKVQPTTTPDGKTVLQVTGSNVVVQGDTYTMMVDGATLQPVSVQITTTTPEGDNVTVNATFKTIKSGLNHLQYATITVPSSNLTVNVHNYDYVPND